MIKIESVTSIKNIVGEGPVWSVARQKLYWVDVRKPAVHAYTPKTGQVETWAMPENVGCLALRRDGTLVLGMQRRMAFFDPRNGVFEDAYLLNGHQVHHRFNDGRCDPMGRFLAGTLKDPSRMIDGSVIDIGERTPEGRIYSLESDRSCRTLLSGFTIPNGFCWSHDGRTMYVADSHIKTIFAFDYDLATGTPSNRQIFARTTDCPGVPDGATIDEEGCIWSAHYGGWCVVRRRPNGTVDRVVDVPVEQPTSLAFGGKDLDILFVTTATQRLDADRLGRQPLAGHLLALQVGIRGCPEPLFQD